MGCSTERVDRAMSRAAEKLLHDGLEIPVSVG